MDIISKTQRNIKYKLAYTVVIKIIHMLKNKSISLHVQLCLIRQRANTTSCGQFAGILGAQTL